MGLLDSVPGESSDTSTDSADTEASTAEAEGAEAKPAPTERVDLPKTPSRRERAKQDSDAILTELKTIRESHNRTADEMRSALAARDAEIARLRGGYEALQPIVQQRHNEANRAPDASQLRKEAQEAIDRGDFTTYQQKFAESVKADIVATLPRQEQQQHYAPPPLDPRLQVIMGQHAEVVTHPQGLKLAMIEDQKLGQVYGIPDGPDRWSRAFQIAKAQLGATAPTNGYSQQSAGALAGVPTTNGGGRGQSRDPGVELTEHEKGVARAADMSYAEYAKFLAEASPNRVVK